MERTMSESLSKESLIEIAESIIELARKLGIFLETNFGNLTDTEFTTLHFLQARLASTAGDLARQAATIEQTGIKDLQDQLEKATAEALRAIQKIEQSKQMLTFAAAVLDFAVSLSMGVTTGKWTGVVTAGSKVVQLAATI